MLFYGVKGIVWLKLFAFDVIASRKGIVDSLVIVVFVCRRLRIHENINLHEIFFENMPKIVNIFALIANCLFYNLREKIMM